MPQEGATRLVRGQKEVWFSETGWTPLGPARSRGTGGRGTPPPAYRAPAGLEDDLEVGNQDAVNARLGITPAQPIKPTEPKTPPYRSRRQGLESVYPDRYKKPTEPTVQTRQAPPPNPGADDNATGTQMGGVGKPADFGAFEQRLSGDFGIAFNFTGNAPTLPGAKNQQQTNTQYATQDEALAGAFANGEITPYLKGYTGDANDRSAQVAYARNHGYMGSMDNFGTEGANPEAGNSPVPDKAGQQTGLSFGQGVGQAFDGTGTTATKTVVPRKRRGSARQQEFAERPGNIEAPPESTAPAGRPRVNRSFLDYDGPGGSLMALRALEASQGTMKQNGVTYGKNAGGEWVALTDEAAQALKGDRSTVATVDFVAANQFKPVATATAEQPEPQDYTPIPKGETKSVGGYPTTEGNYDEMDAGTKAAVDIVRNGVDFNSSNVLDGMKDEKDPQSFLMQKLNEVGLGK